MLSAVKDAKYSVRIEVYIVLGTQTGGLKRYSSRVLYGPQTEGLIKQSIRCLYINLLSKSVFYMASSCPHPLVVPSFPIPHNTLCQADQCFCCGLYPCEQEWTCTSFAFKLSLQSQRILSGKLLISFEIYLLCVCSFAT